MPTTDDRGIVSKSKLTALSTAIKTKAGVSGTYTLDDLVDVVDDIEAGGITPTGTIQIAENGTFDVTQFASAAVNVSGGGGSDISPFKFVKGTITPSENTQALTFPCGDITTVVLFEAKVVNYDNYISEDNNGMGLGRVHYNFRPYFDNRVYNGSVGGNVLSVFNGAFDYWNATNIPTIDAANQTAMFAGRAEATFKAGIPIEYVMWGV